MNVRLLRAVALGLLVGLVVLWWLLPQGIGQLLRKAGTVERDLHDRQGVFTAAEPGVSFEVGDGLRTGAAASAEVQLLDGPLLKVRAATLIRFRGGAPGAQRVALSHGEVSIFTVQDPVLFETAAGLVKVSPHSRAVLHEEGHETWVEVILGRAELEWASASRRSLGAGESAHVVHATSEAAATQPAIAKQTGPELPAAQPSNATPGQPTADAKPVDVTQPDFLVSAAPLITVFDASPPTLLGFAQPCGQGKANLEVEQDARFVASGAVHAFQPGTSRYRLRCGARVLSSGKVRVVQDAGQRALSEAAPTNMVEADGRSYTVLYQTRLPDLSVRWPSAGPATRSSLVVESGADRRSFPVQGPEAKLASGTLVDGEHKLWFQVDGSDQRSRTTRLEIRFDNATPLARLNQPGTLPLSEAGTATVSGVVVAGARVSIRGSRVALDASGRFSTSITPRPGERGVAVMVELPRRSVVYYVRRFRVANAAP